MKNFLHMLDYLKLLSEETKSSETSQLAILPINKSVLLQNISLLYIVTLMNRLHTYNIK